MNSIEKEITYRLTNSYSTLNTFTKSTKTVWFVCHGMGQLSARFIQNFKNLDKDENYIFAPQAQSKYYHSTEYQTVGASWLTKENTIKETENVLRYFDAIWANEKIPQDVMFNFLGFSQGVSVVMRYIAKRKIKFQKLILFAGGLPLELENHDFGFLDHSSEVLFFYGNKDEYLNETRISSEMERLKNLFPDQTRIIKFNGSHQFDFQVVQENI